MAKVLGDKKTPAEVMPESMLKGKYGKEAEQLVTAAVECMHAMLLSRWAMEDAKDKTRMGLYGSDIDELFVRKAQDGSDVTIVNAIVLAAMCKRLYEQFPDDPILVDEDFTVVSRDEGFCKNVARMLSNYDIAEGCTVDDVLKWSNHAGSFQKKLIELEGEVPHRYWALESINNLEEFRAQKQFCFTMALIEDSQPVVSVMGCPCMEFDHVTRSRPHWNGCPIFFAAKGYGSWTQLLILNRDQGRYSGDFKLYGPAMQLDCKNKINRKGDQLWDSVGTEQLRIAMDSRLRQDIVVDAEKIAKILGSDYPKMEMTTSNVKYAWLARGEADMLWYFPMGLYGKGTGTERLIHHAAGSLIAQEAGAEVTDLDGKEIEWCGRTLDRNRGMVGTDPNKIALKGAVRAIALATDDSTVRYEDRCEKRLEVSKMLSKVFYTMAELAETPEEKAGAAAVLKKGILELEDEVTMNEYAQKSMNREMPILGRPVLPDNAFKD